MQNSTVMTTMCRLLDNPTPPTWKQDAICLGCFVLIVFAAYALGRVLEARRCRKQTLRLLAEHESATKQAAESYRAKGHEIPCVIKVVSDKRVGK